MAMWSIAAGNLIVYAEHANFGDIKQQISIGWSISAPMAMWSIAAVHGDSA
eukprot:CAMPEP_0195508358 /NCGR_PEP_ID=MMETSP0794_2-20130614/1584_1 /TAXON_ID=515487 /ORGANISM="Stephanopyxis turris, Strain CCMP 815" /LENGTH=50 /DNA_ID=CAMNT_0040635295 /DNA_START=1 /DNA_END=153 /DNA_ORIENTATION=-